MKRSTLALSVLLALMMLAPTGCESKREKAQDKMIGLMDEYADILSGIKSNTDFVDAKPKLERLGAKMKDLANEVKDLPKPTDEETKALQKKFEARSEKTGKRVQSELERLAKIGVSPFEVIGAMKLDPGTMSQMGD